MFLKYYLKGRKGNTKGLDFRGVFKQCCSSFVWAGAIETDRQVVVLNHQLPDLQVLSSLVEKHLEQADFQSEGER